MNNATKNNETKIRWYTGVEYTIKELFNTRKNDRIDGMGLVEIIKHVLIHGSFNPICPINGKKFGIDIYLINKGDDASEYTKEPEKKDTHDEIIEEEIEKLEIRLLEAQNRLWCAKNDGVWDYRRVNTINSHIDFLRRRLKALYKK